MQTAEEIERRLVQLGGWPPEIRKWTVERGEDATGDDAVWVWIEVPEDSLDGERRQAIRDRVWDFVLAELRTLSPGLIPYVRFTSEDSPSGADRGSGV